MLNQRNVLKDRHSPYVPLPFHPFHPSLLLASPTLPPSHPPLLLPQLVLNQRNVLKDRSYNGVYNTPMLNSTMPASQLATQVGGGPYSGIQRAVLT